jgi:outer membrane lipoprotein-sorting protein
MRIAAAGGVTALCLMASGCLSHTRAVQQVRRVTNAQTATLEQLIQQINKRDEAIQSLSLSVTMAASVGGATAGRVTDYTSLSGYILLQKPEQLRVLGLVPVVHSKAFDMASNGDTFKLLIPSKNKMIAGSNKIVKTSPNPLENLRPYIFSESLLVHAVNSSDFTYLAGETRYNTDPRTKQMVELVDYDVGVLHRKGETNQLLPSRIIHINRQTLLPYEQDLYDANGAIETQALYSDYRDFNGTQFPASITIRRPLEEYEIKLTVDKLLNVNQKITNEEFELTAPAGVEIQQLP